MTSEECKQKFNEDPGLIIIDRGEDGNTYKWKGGEVCAVSAEMLLVFLGWYLSGELRNWKLELLAVDFQMGVLFVRRTDG